MILNRNYRIGSGLAALALLLLPGAACAPAGPPADARIAEPAGSQLPLWEVRHEGAPLYLMGSVHLLRPDVYPLDDRFYEVFDRAEVVAFELDFEEMMAAAPMMMQRGMYQDARTLRDAVPEALYDEVLERVAPLGIPAEMIDQMKPWMAALMLSTVMIQQAGYEAESGIDMHFHALAQERGMPIVGLETMEEQLEVFDGLSRDAQVAFLRSTLEQMDDTVEEMDRATEFWRRGDAEGLAEMFVESMGDQSELTEALLYERNRSWIPGIAALMADGRPTVVIVGMGHLVGEENVVDLLRERGYEVVQLRSAERVGAGSRNDDNATGDRDGDGRSLVVTEGDPRGTPSRPKRSTPAPFHL